MVAETSAFPGSDGKYEASLKLVTSANYTAWDCYNEVAKANLFDPAQARLDIASK